MTSSTVFEPTFGFARNDVALANPERRISAVSIARVTIARTRVTASGRVDSSNRNGQGNASTHCRIGTAGSTWSMADCFAIS